MNNLSKIAIIVVLITSYMISVGQGCSKNSGGSGGASVNAQSDYAKTDGTVPNTITLSIVYGKQILDHMVSCLGTEVPTQRAITMYEQKEGTISVSGDAGTLSAPMMMGETSIVGEVCKDLVDKEKTSPRMFIGVDLNGTTLPSDSAINDSIRRLALSCWGNIEDDAEREMIKSALTESFGSDNAANTSHDAMLFMCTAMLSSTNALIL